MNSRDGFRRRHLLWAAPFVTALVILPALAAGAQANAFRQHNLVSDIAGIADHLDPDLANPWGIAFGPTSPFWVADNHTGLSTLYNGSGVKQGLVVTIPPASGGMPPASPTGIVFNGTNDFVVDGKPARFIFASEDGVISAWPSSVITNGFRTVDNSASGAVYKGIALDNNGAGNFLYATNFSQGKIDVFDSLFGSAMTGSFVDPGLPSGFAPFNIQNISGDLYVTYAKQGPGGEDDEAGPGNGFVDVFDANGVLERRLISHDHLNSPWGLALAPVGFGPFGGDLLVGNFGDGTINAFDPTNGAFVGTLNDEAGNSISIEGLWALTFGNGGNGGQADRLYFTAGISGGGAKEDHGLFGSVQAVPETSSIVILACLIAPGAVALLRRRTFARA